MRCLRHENEFTTEPRNGFHQLLNSAPFSVSVLHLCNPVQYAAARHTGWRDGQGNW